MTLTFLGTGTSQGVPVIGCTCSVCLSQDDRDKRLRTSALIRIDHTQILIDCGPDFRQQMIRANTYDLDAILFTHHHNDHVLGIDDLRPINFLLKKNIDVFLNEKTLESLKKRFDYIFESDYPGLTGISPSVVKAGDTWDINNVAIKALEVDHGFEKILGYKIGEMVYLTDVKRLSNHTINLIKECQVLIISALRHKEHRTHLSLKEALDLIEVIRPEKAYLIHMSHLIGLREEVEQELPNSVYLAYDGLEVKV